MSTHTERHRLHLVIEGHYVQLYFDTAEEREAYRFEAAKMLGFNTDAGLLRNSVKDARAKDQSLPIGISEIVGERHKVTKAKVLKTRKGKAIGRFSAWIGNKLIARRYGNKRDRDQALAEIVQVRLEYVNSLKKDA